MFKAYGDRRYICLPFVIGMDSPADRCGHAERESQVHFVSPKFILCPCVKFIWCLPKSFCVFVSNSFYVGPATLLSSVTTKIPHLAL